MKRSLLLAGAACATAAIALPRPARAEEITVDNGGRLYGTLEVPRATGRPPVVLIIGGSGPTDRDGNTRLMSGKNDSLKMLSEALVARGVAAVRYDKRGVGTSRDAALGSDLMFETYVADAIAWIVTMRASRRFSRIFIAGHSEGSLIGMLAGQRQPIDGFASLEGAGHPAATVLRAQMRGTPPDIRDAAYALIASLEAGKTMPPPGAVASLFPIAVQPYMISWFRFDPAQELRRLRVPTVIVQGTADVQSSPIEGESLAAAMPSARYVTVPGMNHVLKYAPDTSSQTAIIAGYTNPSLPVMPAVPSAVAALTG